MEIRRDILIESNFSGTWFAKNMPSSEEGHTDETWSVKQIHTGRLIVFYRSKNRYSISSYGSLEEMETDAMPDDIRDWIMRIAVEAIGAT